MVVPITIITIIKCKYIYNTHWQASDHRDLYTGGLYSLNLSTMIDFNTLRSGYFHFFPVSDDYTHTSSNSVYWLFQTEQFPPFSRS